jgi:hypothetical protein
MADLNEIDVTNHKPRSFKSTSRTSLWVREAQLPGAAIRYFHSDNFIQI